MKERKTARLTITVPKEMIEKIQLKRETDYSFNVSQICTNALKGVLND